MTALSDWLINYPYFMENYNVNNKYSSTPC